MSFDANEVVSKLNNFHHLMEANIQDCQFDENNADEDDDPENPGFLKGWLHFLDVTTNTIISFNKEDMIIEVMLGDNTNCIIKNEEKIAKFLKLQDVKSLQFKNSEMMNRL